MPVTPESIAQYAAEIETVCDNLVPWNQHSRSRPVRTLRRLSQLASRYPVSVASDYDAAGVDAILSALEDDPDVIVFDFPHSAVLRPAELDVPTVMFTHNVETEIFRRHCDHARSWLMRHLWRSQYRKMLRFERDVLATFDVVVAVSERDRTFFLDDWGISNCRAIPTGVDVEYFEYANPDSDDQVVFCGSMDWMANIDAIEFFHDLVWPMVREQAPNARMKVVGRSPPPGLVNRITAASPEWVFTGFVDDVRDHVCGSGVFVIPLRVGGGTRIKAFEAMAMGTPVVSTSIGVEGLPVENGIHYVGADDPGPMAERITELLNDAGRRESISIAARKLVESEFGYLNAARTFEQICMEGLRVAEERSQNPRNVPGVE